MSSQHFVGIDFGTSKTLVSCWDPQRSQPTTIRLGRECDEIPTTLHISEAGDVVCGDHADDQMHTDPGGYLRRIKRELGENESVYLSGAPRSVETLVTVYLRRIHQALTEHFGQPVKEAVFTVPALYGKQRRQALAQCAAGAGFSAVKMMYEPVAAGLSYMDAHSHKALADNVLVFDWGGGTLDLAVLRRVEQEATLHTVVPELVGGDAMLGGEDIDDRLYEHFRHLLPDGLSKVDRLRGEIHLRSGIRELKHQLSARKHAEFKVAVPGLGVKDIKLQRAEFSSLINDMIERAIDAAREMVAAARDNGTPVQQVLLAGGSTRLEAIRSGLQNALELPILQFSRCNEAVSLGAAVAAKDDLAAVIQVDPVRPLPPDDMPAQLRRRFDAGDWAVLEEMLRLQLRQEHIKVADNLIGSLLTCSQQTRAAALDDIQEAADHGWAPAKAILAQCRESGGLLEQDGTEAYILYRTLYDDHNNAFAAWRLSHLHDKGEGCAKSPAKSRNYLEAAAGWGYTPAQHDLACLLLASDDEDERFEGLIQLQLAAETSDESLRLLGHEFLKRPEHRTEGLDIIMELAQRGNPDAAVDAMRQMREENKVDEARRFARRCLTLEVDDKAAEEARLYLLEWQGPICCLQADHQKLFPKVLQWYRTRADAGDLSAVRALIGCALSVRSGKLKPGKGLILARRHLTAGADIQTSYLRLLLRDGPYHPGDLRQARELVEGADPADTALVAALEFKHGDKSEGLVQLRRASEHGNAVAQRVLATAYLEGEGVRQDHAQGKRWMARAASIGDQDALRWMAQESLSSTARADKAQGMKWMQQLADDGCPRALNYIGNYQKNDKANPTQAERQEIFAMLRTAATDVTDAAALHDLGKCYLDGYGCRKNIKRAIKLFERAVELSDAPQYKLALARSILKRNPSHAVCLLEKAADQGYADAWYELFECHLYGLGVRKNPQLSSTCLIKAASAGHQGARAILKARQREADEKQRQADAKKRRRKADEKKRQLEAELRHRKSDEKKMQAEAKQRQRKSHEKKRQADAKKRQRESYDEESHMLMLEKWQREAYEKQRVADAKKRQREADEYIQADDAHRGCFGQLIVWVVLLCLIIGVWVFVFHVGAPMFVGWVLSAPFVYYWNRYFDSQLP